MPASHVVGAAVSEVEHYARIEVASAPDIAVQGRAVSDLVHVIAELLDNATFFSPADKKVIVRMAMTRKKELAIQITDQGVGMSEEEIAATNARLADPPDLDVAVTRRMGLYVVARLAKRHNITVRLRDNEDIEGGLIARINVPAELVQKTDSTVGHQPPESVEHSSDFALASAAPGWEDAPTERLPVYEAVLSQWFEAADARSGGQSEETTTVAAESAKDATKYPQREPWFSPGDERSQAGRALLASTEQEALAAAGSPELVPETKLVPESASPAPEADVLVSTPWTSPGDGGWQAAQALLKEETPDATTATGLPKRVPNAHLVPGSAAPRHEVKELTGDEPAPPLRSADAVRGRMSSFQQGVRSGRRALIEAYEGEKIGTDERQQDVEHK